MPSFLERMKDAVAQGQRAGKLVLTLERILGRSLSREEREAFKHYFDTHGFSPSSSDENIILSYFYFLLSEEPTPYGQTAPKMPMEAKARLISCVQHAIDARILSEECRSDLDWLRSAAKV